MFTLAHITDLHYPPLPHIARKEWNAKRILGYLSWHRNRKHHHRADILDKTITDIKQHAPDHICITGDITNLGLEAEYIHTKSLLDTLYPADQISIIPGNHDVYGKNAAGLMAVHWHRWMAPDAKFPYVHLRGPCAVIGLSSAIPTLPFMANGHVSHDQCDKLAELLELHKDKQRVILIHHPPQHGAAPYRKALHAPDYFKDIVKKHGAELILHGHMHKPMIDKIGNTEVYGAGSASHQKAHYHVFEIPEKGTDKKIHAIHRAYDIKRSKFI